FRWISANKHGLKLFQVLTQLNLIIKKAYISSDGGWFMDVFSVTYQDGNRVTNCCQISRGKPALQCLFSGQPFVFAVMVMVALYLLARERKLSTQILNRFPNIDLKYEIVGSNEVSPGKDIILQVILERDMEERTEVGPVHAPRYPKTNEQGWWLVVGDEAVDGHQETLSTTECEDDLATKKKDLVNTPVDLYPPENPMLAPSQMMDSFRENLWHDGGFNVHTDAGTSFRGNNIDRPLEMGWNMAQFPADSGIIAKFQVDPNLDNGPPLNVSEDFQSSGGNGHDDAKCGETSSNLVEQSQDSNANKRNKLLIL
ncbi:unnamed protein product, partial [Arabidopsis halleri]